MVFTVIEHPVYYIFSIGTKVDIGEIREIEEHVEQKIKEGIKYMAISLSGLDWIYSGHFSVFVGCHKKLDERGGRFVLIVDEEQEKINYLLNIMGLNKIFPIVRGIEVL
jgi:anti-anti-sigma factor